MSELKMDAFKLYDLCKSSMFQKFTIASDWMDGFL